MNFQGNSIEMRINDEVLSKEIAFSLYQGTIMPVTLSNFDWFTGHLCVIDDLSIRYIDNSLL